MYPPSFAYLTGCVARTKQRRQQVGENGERQIGVDCCLMRCITELALCAISGSSEEPDETLLAS
jgi:hypothetical protein